MRRELENHTYRVYVTETLKAIAENTSHVVPGGKAMTKSWIELIDIDKPQEPVKTGDEIAIDVIAHAGLFQKGGE